MGFVPFDNVIKLEPVFIYDGQYIENVMNYWVETGVTPETLEALADAWITAWTGGVQNWTSDAATLVKVKCTSLETQNAPGIEYTTGLPLTGQSAATGAPSNVTVAVRWLTAYRGRSYRGRTYHVGMTENMYTLNTLESIAVAGLLDEYEKLIVLDLDGENDAVMVIASRIANGVERVTGLATPVTNLAVDPTIDSQRRRLPGRGR